MNPEKLAEFVPTFAGLAFLAGVGHVASLLVGIIDHTDRRDRPFGVLILFLLMCSPIFFDTRPHDLPVMGFAFAIYLVAISWLEMRVATSTHLRQFMQFSLVVSIAFAAAAFVKLALNLPLVANPAAYASLLLSRNVVLFLILTRGAYFAFKRKHLRAFAFLYPLMCIGAPFITDFALAVCGPLLTLGIWAVGLDLRALRRKIAL